MAITLSKVSKFISKFLKQPPLIMLVIILLILLYQWNEHYMHPIAFSSKNIKVIDGDTIQLDNKRIRLQGIDAPELKQFCTTLVEGKPEEWPCGGFASTRLAKLIGHYNRVNCTDEGKDRYGRTLSYCFVGSTNLNREMVRQGFALAYTKYDLTFTLDEIIARIYKRGIWISQFDEPWKWRKEHKKQKKLKQHNY